MKTIPSIQRTHTVLLVACLTLGLALRVATLFYVGPNRGPDRTSSGADAVEFEHGAWTLAQGEDLRDLKGEYSAFRAPGYPLALASLYALFGRNYLLNGILQIASSLATCVLVYFVAMRCTLSERNALLACAAFCLLPIQWYYCAIFASEPLAGFLSIATVYALLLAVPDGQEPVGNSSYTWLAIAGIANGLSMLVRPIALLVIPTLAVMLVVQHSFRFRRVVVGVLVFFMAHALVVAPWTIRNYVRFDRLALVSSNGGSTFWGANNPVVADRANHEWGSWISTNFAGDVKKREVLVLENEIDRDKMEYRLGLRFLTEHPEQIGNLLLGKCLGLFRVFPTSNNQRFAWIIGAGELLFFPLAVLGVVLVLADANLRSRFLPLTVFVVVLLETTLIFYMSIRFRAPTEPILAVFFAVGTGWLADRYLPLRESMGRLRQ